MGSSVSAGVGVGIRPSSLSDATNSPIATNPRVLNVVDDMSGAQLVRMKKRCADLLSSQDAYDRDLRQLCQLIAGR